MADIMVLSAKLQLDKKNYEDGLNQAENQANKSGGKISSVISTVNKVAVAGLAASATAVGVLAKKSFSAYAEYEQMVGGVDTLFKDASKKVQNYAANAYKTAGISANQYMEQVTSFSATLLQGLNGDTAKAADIANVAITDMADNANKMGTSMDMIQNAYQGFAKQNYTIKLMSVA